MTQRPSPIFFWSYNTNQAAKNGPRLYLNLELQEGTTPLVKMMDGRFTRNFRNFHHPGITKQDFEGPRVVLDNRFKLVIDGQAGEQHKNELFDLRSDSAKANNLIETEPAVVRKLERQLHRWQESVLNSLTGADY